MVICRSSYHHITGHSVKGLRHYRFKWFVDILISQALQGLGAFADLSLLRAFPVCPLVSIFRLHPLHTIYS